jgi:hypothetical protein
MDESEALTGMLVALIDHSSELVCYGVVIAVSEGIYFIVVPVLADHERTVHLIRGSVSFSPAESAYFEGGSVANRSLDEPYQLDHVLGGLETGATNPKNRSNLGRKRLL